MNPELIAAIRDDHQQAPNREYTDCAICFEEWPCQIITALDALAASEARANAAEAHVRQVVAGEQRTLDQLIGVTSERDALAAANQRLRALVRRAETIIADEWTGPDGEVLSGMGDWLTAARALLAELPGATHVVECEPAEFGSWVVCSCGWKLKVRGSVFEAQHAADEHILSMRLPCGVGSEGGAG